MYNFKNKNLFSDDILKTNKNNNYYYDFGTGSKIERADVKENRAAFLGVSSKPTNQKKDDFLEGFNDPYGEKREQERKEKFANIRANADKRNWASQSITDPFLNGFNGISTEENKWISDLFEEKEIGILNPQLPNESGRTFRDSQFESKLNPPVQRINPSPSITPAINRNLNAKNEFEHAIGDPNKEPVMVQCSADKKTTMRFENGDYAAAQREAKEEQYKKKITENAEMNGKSVSKTRKATEVIVKNAEFIKSAAKRHGVNPAILAACIYTEQANNVTITEDLEDATQSFLGMDCSVGLGQVRVSTAKKVEESGHMPTTYDGETRTYAFRNPLTGKSVYWSDAYSRDEEIYNKLKDPETNINYAAAYLAMIQNMWSKEYPNISGDTAILATLYNIGENGGERGINSSPKPREFGLFAKANYSYMQYLLGME